jgi:hypothetical protein
LNRSPPWRFSSKRDPFPLSSIIKEAAELAGSIFFTLLGLGTLEPLGPRNKWKLFKRLSIKSQKYPIMTIFINKTNKSSRTTYFCFSTGVGQQRTFAKSSAVVLIEVASNLSFPSSLKRIVTGRKRRTTTKLSENVFQQHQ